MRVLHLVPNLERQGAQIFVYNLATIDVSDRIRSVVCAWQRGGALLETFRAREVPIFVPDEIHRFSTPRRTLGFIDGVVTSANVDLIHAHMADAAVWGWLAARRRGLPLLITYHSNRLRSKSNPIWSAVRLVGLPLAARYATHNVAISESVAGRVSRSLALGPGCVSVVHNGVHIPAAHARDTPQYHGEAGPCIVAIGRLVEIKGHEQLIAAAAVLVERLPNARVLIIGAGPLEERLRRQAASLGLSNHVHLTGPTDDVPAYLNEADVYVTTSHHEGTPLATLEAMASGVPVVASNVPGHSDLIEHGVNGLLYPLGDIDALARAIIDVVREPRCARTRALQARQLVEKSYSIDAAAGSYERLYAEALGLGHGVA